MGDRERQPGQYERDRGRYDYRDEARYRSSQNQPRIARDWDERDDYRRNEERSYSFERQAQGPRRREERDELQGYGGYSGSSYDELASERNRGYGSESGSFGSRDYSQYGGGRDYSQYGSGRDYAPWGAERERSYSNYPAERANIGGNTLRGGYGADYGSGGSYGGYVPSQRQYGRDWGNYQGPQRGREHEGFGQQLRHAGQQIARSVKRAFRGPKGYKRSDERIREDVNDRLSQQDDFDPSDIEVAVANGDVTLTGTVQSRHEKFLAEEIADDVSGVNDVHNQLRVRREQASTQYATESTTSTTQSAGTEAARNRNARA